MPIELSFQFSETIANGVKRNISLIRAQRDASFYIPLSTRTLYIKNDVNETNTTYTITTITSPTTSNVVYFNTVHLYLRLSFT